MMKSLEPVTNGMTKSPTWAAKGKVTKCGSSRGAGVVEGNRRSGGVRGEWRQQPARHFGRRPQAPRELVAGSKALERRDGTVQETIRTREGYAQVMNGPRDFKVRGS